VTDDGNRIVTAAACDGQEGSLYRAVRGLPQKSVIG